MEIYFSRKQTVFRNLFNIQTFFKRKKILLISLKYEHNGSQAK